MPNRIVCPNCGKEYPARPDLFGRRVGCKQCGQAFTAQDPSSAPPIESALGGLLDEVMAESANAEVRAREAEEINPRPKKKSKKKPSKSGFSVLASPANTPLIAIAILGWLGVPTLLAVISGGESLERMALTIIISTYLATTVYVSWCFIKMGDVAIVVLFWICFFFCGPLFVAVILYFLITKLDDYHLPLLSYVACLFCFVVLIIASG